MRVAENRVLALVSTPLQWINANEAIEQLGFAGVEIIVLSHSYPRQTFACLLRARGVKAWHFFESPVKDETGYYGLLIERTLRVFRESRVMARVLREMEISQIDTLILGHSLDVLHRHFANTVRASRTILVDDGAQILKTMADIETGRLVAPRRNIQLRLLYRLAGLRYQGFPPVELFTAYNLKNGRVRTIRNDYRLTRALVSKAPRPVDEVWIIGQYFYLDGMMTPEDYFGTLAGLVREHYQGLEVRYILHPREVETDGLSLLTRLEVSPVKLEMGVELFLISKGILPRRIATYYSSVFQTCQMIFGDLIPFDIVDPEPLWVNENARRTVGPIYAFLRNRSVPPHRLFMADGKTLRESSGHGWD